jgi:hypothetical protein
LTVGPFEAKPKTPSHWERDKSLKEAKKR